MSNIQTGIYFLIKDGIIIYIGQSTRITKRIRDHKRDKDFDHYRVIACNESLLLQYEKRLIKYFKPRLNGVTGGKREGAGRTKGSFVNVQKKEPTKVIRVPVSKLEAVKELIKNT